MYFNFQNGIMKVVRNWLFSSTSSGYSLRVSIFVKILALSSATVSAGVTDESVQAGEVDGHSYLVCTFLGGDHDGCSDRSNDPLFSSSYCSRQTGLREVCGCRMGRHHLRGQSELPHPNSLLRLTGTKVAGF